MRTNFLKYTDALYGNPDYMRRIRLTINDILTMFRVMLDYGVAGLKRETETIVTLKAEHIVWRSIMISVCSQDSARVITLIANNYIDCMPEDDLIERYNSYLYYLGAICIVEEEDIGTLQRIITSAVPLKYVDVINKEFDNWVAAYEE